MNLSVRDVSLESLMDQKLNQHPELQNSKEAGTELARVRRELESVKTQRQQTLQEIAAIHDNAAKVMALEEDMKRLNRQKAMLTHQLDKLKDKQKSDYRTLDATRRRFRNEVLQEADVICSTLSAAAYEYLEPFDFELVIIDEAAQAIELSSLIPMKYRCRTCIMVGGDLFPCITFRVITDVKVRSAAVATNSEIPGGLYTDRFTVEDADAHTVRRRADLATTNHCSSDCRRVSQTPSIC